MDLDTLRTCAHISLSALEQNYHALRALLPSPCRFLGVVKANAYGHGAIPVAQKLETLGCDMLAVACLAEAEQLRAAGITAPILILGPTQPEFAGRVVQAELTQTVGEPILARALSDAAGRLGLRARIHIKLDTGMGRTGILAHSSDAAADAAAAICALPHLEAEGVFTHFSCADSDEAYTMLQFTRFLDALDAMERRHRLTFPIRHCASSAAVLNYPCTHLDMVRPGIALYGYSPDPSCLENAPVTLAPVMSLCTRVAAVRDLPAGTPISYGATRTLQRDSRVAVLPVGYADGLHRVLSDRIRIPMAGGYAPLLGRICMDMCMVDITDLPDVCVGDEVCLFGPEGALEEYAAIAGTITYELLCAVSPRVPRIYIG